MSQQPTAHTGHTVTLHLLDPALGRPLQVWRLEARPLITIGRGDDCDVPLADPYVSRRHVELHRRDGHWSLVSLGRAGVVVNGQPVQETRLADGQTFRLGESGPTFRFLDSSAAAENSATLYHATEELAFFQVDKAKVHQEVRQITDSDYFQQLQQKADQLRQARNP